MSGSEGQGLSQYVTVDETLPVMQETQPNTPDMTIRTQDVVDAISVVNESTMMSRLS